MYARTLLYKQSGGISMKQQVNLEIMDFVEKQILPKYNAFGESHGLRHVTRVIRNSLKLVPVTGADIDMVYVIAAYHDGNERSTCHSPHHQRQDSAGRCKTEALVRSGAD